MKKLLISIMVMAMSSSAHCHVYPDYVWYTYNGHQYAATLGHSNWADAEAEAEACALGGHLVTINDAAENTWLTNKFGGHYSVIGQGIPSGSLIWIGLELVDEEWRWVSGEPVTYMAPWYSGSPADPPGTHAYLHPSTNPFAGIWWNFPIHDTNPDDYPHGIIEISEPAEFMEWVTVGDAGNMADDTGYGSVGYVYRIGKYEVTNEQYCDFLNSIADVCDMHNLYSPDMNNPTYGGIERSGSAGSYSYSPKSGRGNWPVNYVSFYDALRFANWLHNSQPTGLQDNSTTEDGAYDMDGDLTTHKPSAGYWLPTEDEWYKAAYYKGSCTNAGYWDYATQSDAEPNREAPPGTDIVNGSANYDWAVGGPTDVGAYTHSESAYGTFDQSGNFWEWTEALIVESNRSLRGGSLSNNASYVAATFRNGYGSQGYETYNAGFRVAGVAEAAGCLVEAIAFQDDEYEYPAFSFSQLSAVSMLDGVWSLVDIPVVTGGEHDYYCNGSAYNWFDALSLEFEPGNLDICNLVLRVYMQKGNYGAFGADQHRYEHYQLLPGKFNPHNEDRDPLYFPDPPDVIDHFPGGELPDNEIVGWVEIPFDATSNPEYKLPNGNIALTLRLWNWRVDKIELVSGPADPVELLGELAGKVFGLNLQQGIENSLDAKLDAALHALEDINQNNDVAAINTLQAFINAVEAQRGNKIPVADADALIAAVLEIIELLGAE